MSFINWGEETSEQKAARRYFEEQQALFEQAVRFSRTTGAMAGVGTGGSTTPATFTFKSNNNQLLIFIEQTGDWFNDQSRERTIVIDWGDGVSETNTFTFYNHMLSHIYDKQNDDEIKINLTVDFEIGSINFNHMNMGINQLTELSLGELPSVERIELYGNLLTYFNIAAPLPSSLYYLGIQANQLVDFDASKLTSNVQRLLLGMNPLTTASVNKILISLNEKYTVPPDYMLPQIFELTGTGWSPPTGAGLAAKTALQARGYTVYTN